MISYKRETCTGHLAWINQPIYLLFIFVKSTFTKYQTWSRHMAECCPCTISYSPLGNLMRQMLFLSTWQVRRWMLWDLVVSWLQPPGQKLTEPGQEKSLLEIRTVPLEPSSDKLELFKAIVGSCAWFTNTWEWVEKWLFCETEPNNHHHHNKRSGGSTPCSLCEWLVWEWGGAELQGAWEEVELPAVSHGHPLPHIFYHRTFLVVPFLAPSDKRYPEL